MGDMIMTPELNRLRRALDCMPVPARTVFERARFEDQGYDEIAEALGLTVDEVELRMAEAILHMARAIDADG
jgi:DNA-directed RNA polymerase specialized sigma24 family protein